MGNCLWAVKISCSLFAFGNQKLKLETVSANTRVMCFWGSSDKIFVDRCQVSPSDTGFWCCLGWLVLPCLRGFPGSNCESTSKLTLLPVLATVFFYFLQSWMLASSQIAL